MNDKQKAVIKRLELSDMKQIASIVKDRFDNGFTYDEVWASLDFAAEIFKDIAWETRRK